jgi:hypothetical protein
LLELPFAPIYGRMRSYLISALFNAKVY